MIYGACNRAGIAFSKYLARQGFNLILIDRDMQPLKDLEKILKEQFTNVLPTIHLISMTQFEADSVRNAILPIKDLPVKLFINCKNSKRNSKNMRSPLNSNGLDNFNEEELIQR